MKFLAYTSLFPNAAQPDLGVFILQRMSHFTARPGNGVCVLAPVPCLPAWLPGEQWKKYNGIPLETAVPDMAALPPRPMHSSA